MTEIQTTVVTIHFRGEEDYFAGVLADPLRITADAAGNIQTTGVEGDFIGLSRTDVHGLDHALYRVLCPGSGMRIGDPENWVDARDILSEGAAPERRRGWFPAFRSGEWIYTWSSPVDRVEVTERTWSTTGPRSWRTGHPHTRPAGL